VEGGTGEGAAAHRLVVVVGATKVLQCCREHGKPAQGPDVVRTVMWSGPCYLLLSAGLLRNTKPQPTTSQHAKDGSCLNSFLNFMLQRE
jgi:hypothetical protein